MPAPQSARAHPRPQVHQGDGTAALLAGRPGARVLDVHAARNFPARKSAADVDIALPDGAGDEEYLAALAAALPRALSDFGPVDLVLCVDVTPQRRRRRRRRRLASSPLCPARAARRRRLVLTRPRPPPARARSGTTRGWMCTLTTRSGGWR
jgi:hypothetical protein